MPVGDKSKTIGEVETDPAILAQLNASDEGSDNKPISDKVNDALISKLPIDKREMVLAQLRHETGKPDLDSHVAKLNNNVSGITWNDNFPEEWKGSLRPSEEGGNYVHFPTYADWAKEHLKLLNKDSGFGAPIDADSIEDFAHRLKKNRYYDAPESVYVKGMKKMQDDYGADLEKETDPAILAQLNASETPLAATTQKKSPDESATGLANTSQTGQTGVSENDNPLNIQYAQSNPGAIASTGINPTPSGILDAPNQPLVREQPITAPATLPFTNIPVSKPDQTPDEIKSETGNKSAGLANFITQNAGRLPGYAANLKNTNFTQPGNIVHDLTDIHGDPTKTGGILQTGLSLIDQDEKADILHAKSGENDPFQEANAVKAIKDKYDQQKSDLTDNAGHVMKLQLFNKEYTTKPLTDAEANTKIETLKQQHEDQIKKANAQMEEDLKTDQYKGNMDAADNKRIDAIAQANKNYNQQVQEVNNNTKYNPIKMGAEYRASMGDKTAIQDLQALQSGKPINPARQYQYNIDGREIIQTGHKNAEANGTESATNESAPHLDETGQKLFQNNKPFLVDQAAQAVGNANFEDMGAWSSLAHMIVPSQLIPQPSASEIERLGRSKGLPDYLIDELKKDPSQIPKTASLLQKAAGGSLDAVMPIAAGLYKNVVYPALGGQNFDETHQSGWEQNTGANAAIVGNTPSESNTFTSVTGVVGNMIKTGAMLATLSSGIGDVAKGIGATGIATLPAEKLAQFGTMSALGYNDGYNLSKEVIGDKPDGEWKRQTFAAISGLMQGALFSLEPSTGLIKNALGIETKSGEQLLKEIDKAGGPEFMQTPEGKDLLTKYIQETAKGAGHQVGLMTAQKLGQNIINKISNPDRKQDLTDGLATSAAETAVTMLLPSIFGAVGHVKNQTPLNTAAAFEVGSNPDKYTEVISKGLADGTIAPQQAQVMHEAILGMKSAVSRTPTTNDEGVKLTPDQIKAYSFSLFQEDLLQRKADALTEGAKTANVNVDKAQIDPINKKIAAMTKQRNDILAKAGEQRIPPSSQQNSEPQSNGAIATESQSEEETPTAKKSSEKLENTDKNNIPLSPDQESQNKNEQNEQSSTNEVRSNNEKQVGTEKGNAEDNRPNTEVRKDATEGIQEGQDSGNLLSKKEEEDKQATPKEQPLSVLKKGAEKRIGRKLRAQEPDEEAPAEIPPVKQKEEYAAWDRGTEAGKPADEVNKTIAEASPDEKIGGGESFNEFKDRIKAAWEKTKTSANDQALLIAHSGPMRLIKSAEEHGWDNTDELKKAFLKEPEPTVRDIHTYKTDNGEIHLQRHGESEDGANNLDRTKDTPLTEKGQQEAETTIPENLEKEGIKPSEIITDHLPRTVETAEAVHEAISKPGANKLNERRGTFKTRLTDLEYSIPDTSGKIRLNPDGSFKEAGDYVKDGYTSTSRTPGAKWEKSTGHAEKNAIEQDYPKVKKKWDKDVTADKILNSPVADKVLKLADQLGGLKPLKDFLQKHEYEEVGNTAGVDHDITDWLLNIDDEKRANVEKIVDDGLKETSEKPTTEVTSFETSQGSKYQATEDGKYQRTKTTTGEEFEPQDHTVFIRFKDDEQKQRFLDAQDREGSGVKVSLIGKGNDKKVVLSDAKTGKVIEEAETTNIPTEGYNTFDQRRFTEDGKEKRESHIGNEVTKINYSEPEDNLLPPQPEKPLHEMTGDELEAYHKKLKEYNKNLDKTVLGDRYKEYNDAQRISNSSFASDEARKKADKTIDEIESALTEKQQDALFGRNLPEGFIANDEDVRDFRDKVQSIESAQSESELAKDISQSLIDLNNAPDDVSKMSIKQKLAVAAMRTAKRIVEDRGYDGKEVTEQALKFASGKFSDKNDAEFMLSKYIDYATKQPPSEPNQERSVATEAKSLPEPPKQKPLSTEEKIKVERTLHQRLIDQGKEAEKERQRAIKSKDPDAIQKATDKVNDLKDKTLAKETKIDKLINAQENESIFHKAADYIEKTYEKNKKAHEGATYATILGLSPKISDHISDFLVARIVEALNGIGNVEVAIRRGLRLTKEKYGEEAQELSENDIPALKESGLFKQTHLKNEPVLPIDHEEYAKDILADILAGKMSHEDAVNEINEESFENQHGKTLSDAWAENARGKILNYIDWHVENDVTSIRNATTRLRRAQYGLDDEIPSVHKSEQETIDEAKKEIEDGRDPQNLVDDLVKKPRPLTDVENGILLHYQNTKELKLQELNNNINKAADDGDQAAIDENKLSKARVLDELQQIYDVNKAVGTENARGLASRRMMMDRKYSLVNMIAEKRATANDGKALNENQQVEIEKLHQKVTETQKAFDDYVNQSESKIIDLQRKALSGSLKEKGEKVANRLRAFADKIEKSSKNQLYSSPIPVTPKMVAEAVRLVADGIEKGGQLLDYIQSAIVKITKDNPGVDEKNLEKEINKTLIDAEILEPSKLRREAKGMSGLFSGGKLDREAVRLKVAADRAKAQVDIDLKMDQQKQLSMWAKLQNSFIKWQRAFKLSNPITLGKLSVAAATRLGTDALEDVVGGAWSTVLPKISKGAIGEGGGLNVSTTVKAYKEMMTQGIKDAGDVMRKSTHGKSDLDVLMGRYGELPPEALDFLGQTHSMIKAPIKRYAFEKSLEKRLRRNISVGADVSDPLVQTSIITGALKDANRAIFMQDNAAADWFQRQLRSVEKVDPKTGKSPNKWKATLAQWMIPFVKVPTNIVAETAQGVYGLPVGAGQALHSVFTNGIENLSEDQKDIIFRNLKKGTIGLAAMSMGYFMPQNFGGYYQPGEKRKEDDAKALGLKIGDTKIPAWFVESPIFQLMQLGATVRRIKDKKVHGEENGIIEGVWAGLLGLTENVPMVNQPMRIMKALGSTGERNYFADELAKSTIVPAAVDYTAKLTDPADDRSIGRKIIDPENKRKTPKTFGEHIKSGIPYLREDLPEKNESNFRGW